MTLYDVLSLEQVGLGSTVPHGCQSWAQRRVQRPVTPAPSCPGLHGADVTPVPSATPLYCAGVWLTLREWLDALVGCDALSGRSVKAAAGLMPSRPRARRRIGTSPEAFRWGPRARGLRRGGELVPHPRPCGVGLGRTGESAEALRREPRANRRIGRGLRGCLLALVFTRSKQFFRFLLRVPLSMVSDTANQRI